jgi:hypothetical protein
MILWMKGNCDFVYCDNISVCMYLMLETILWLGKYATCFKWQDNISYSSYLSAFEIKVLMSACEVWIHYDCFGLDWYCKLLMMFMFCCSLQIVAVMLKSPWRERAIVTYFLQTSSQRLRCCSTLQSHKNYQRSSCRHQFILVSPCESGCSHQIPFCLF